MAVSVIDVGELAAHSIGEIASGTTPLEAFDAEQVVTRLFEESWASIFRYVLSFGLSVEDGEEIAQEVFLALFQHVRRGKSRRNLRGWVVAVAHNLALKRRRRNQRHYGSGDLCWRAREDQPDPSLGPEEELLCTQRQLRLQAIVKALPERDQRCLRLRAEGLRYREIARVLGISLGAVSLSLARSLKRLRCAVEGEP